MPATVELTFAELNNYISTAAITLVKDFIFKFFIFILNIGIFSTFIYLTENQQIQTSCTALMALLIVLYILYFEQYFNEVFRNNDISFMPIYLQHYRPIAIIILILKLIITILLTVENKNYIGLIILVISYIQNIIFTTYHN